MSIEQMVKETFKGLEKIDTVNKIVLELARIENKYDFTFHYDKHGRVFLEPLNTGEAVYMVDLIDRMD